MIKFSVALFLSIILITSCKQEVAIVASDDADQVETFAANELSSYLSKIYPKYKFPVQQEAGKGKAIFLDVNKEDTEISENPEGYVISADEENARIVSRGSTGLVYGVYAILESLGCGFYLSDEMLPEPREEFDFDAWKLSDEPLVEGRYVFNWHNFISGCTGWDKKHWLEWIDRSQKMGYNTIMIHTYHNNPMHTYQFNGLEKEVGYINTSAKGRDWGNIPINDVRRLPGGDIFDAAEFGSEIAMVPDDQRVAVAQETMSEVFDYAAARGVKVNFAFDIDMPIFFLQNSMISTIPESDMFYLSGQKLWFPRPDKPEGHKFYKAQLEGLLNTYESIDEIAFFRRGSSFFKDIQPGDLPQEWREEYHHELANHPYLKDLDSKEVIGSFITSKLVLHYQQILEEMGRTDLELGTGSWQHNFVVPTAAFLPPEIKLMPIDWQSRFDNSFMEDEGIVKDFASSTCKDRVVPFIWAHHDDGRYVGRPYKPTVNLNAKLERATSNSFGVFHWMNRPLDLFFKNMSRQVWSNTENESMEKTCTMMATHYFGTEEMETYFLEWMENAPMFGRATLPNFFHRTMDDAVFDFEKAITECKKRIEILDAADLSLMSTQQKAYVEYFKTLEQFIIDFSETQPHFLDAEKFLNEGDIESARKELQAGDPEKCVETFSRLSRIAKDERGEMAYTYRFATKYLPDYMSFEQRTRLKPYYVNIDTVVYEDIAQGSANLTYHIDETGNFWECLGQQSFNSPIIKLPSEPNLQDELQTYEEQFSYGLKITSRDTIPIQPVMRAWAVKNNTHVWEGKYTLEILASSIDDNEVDFDIIVNGKRQHLQVKGKRVIQVPIDIDETGPVSLIVETKIDPVILSGLIMSPV